MGRGPAPISGRLRILELIFHTVKDLQDHILETAGLNQQMIAYLISCALCFACKRTSSGTSHLQMQGGTQRWSDVKLPINNVKTKAL